jgi:beta-mannosidase
LFLAGHIHSSFTFVMRVPAQATMAVLASAVSSPLNDPQIYDLGKLGWTLSSPALNRTVPGHLPSQVHLDLLRAGVIGIHL